MRLITRHPQAEKIKIGEGRKDALSQWLLTSIEDALDARRMQETEWCEAIRLYSGVPKKKRRDWPVPNAPNLTVALAAIAVDSVNAMALDLIFQVDPVLSVKSTRAKVKGDDPRIEQAKACQDWIDHSAVSRYNLREAVENGVLSVVKMGTGVLYAPFVERIVKKRIMKVTESEPRLFALPIEDFLVPPACESDFELAEWIAVRFLLTKQQLTERGKALGWDKEALEACSPIGGVDRVKRARESLGNTNRAGQVEGQVYEIWDIYCTFDIDGDGIAEDLLVVWDRTSKSILRVGYNPYDTRPFSVGRYQRREHLFYAIGAASMLAQEQEASTEILNFWLLNAMLANARMWIGKSGCVPTDKKVWPNRVIEVTDIDGFKPLQMGEAYPSGLAGLNTVIGLSEKRVGINELGASRPSSLMGSRTPGITALTAAQQSNRRFTAAFDSIRMMVGGGAKQCLLRDHERILEMDGDLMNEMRRVLGDERGGALIELLSDPEFPREMSVEVATTSASTNREAERQNGMLVLDRMLQYYDKIFTLAQFSINPQAPPQLVETAKKIVEKGNELFARVLRTFPQMTDPENFLMELDNGFDDAVGEVPDGAQVLNALFAGVGGAAGDPQLDPNNMPLGGGASPTGAV